MESSSACPMTVTTKPRTACLAASIRSFVPPPADFRLAARVGRDLDDQRRAGKKDMNAVFLIWAKEEAFSSGELNGNRRSKHPIRIQRP